MIRQAVALVEEGSRLCGTAQQAGLDDLYQSWAGEAESHLDSLYGISRTQQSSRIHGFVTKLKPVLGLGCNHQTGDSLSFGLRRVLALLYLFRNHYCSNWVLASKARIRALRIVPAQENRPAWALVRQAVRDWPWLSEPQLLRDMAHLDSWARRLEDAAAKRRLLFWKNWQHQALCSDGGRSVYNILKGHQPIPLLVVPADSGGSLRAATFDEVVEARADPWCTLWKTEAPYVEA